MVYQWLNFVQSRLLPPLCLLCSARGQWPDIDLCADCEAELPRNVVACRTCAYPLDGFAAEEGLICGQCQRKKPRIDSCHSACRYAFPVDHLVRGLKYREAIGHSRVLGELLARHLLQHHAGPWPACLVPVPLAAKRYRERGYNQAIELARHLERALGIPLRTDLVERTRDTVEQASLSRKERGKNVRRAFAVCGKLRERHVAIIDDVITTTSTVNEVARVLRRAGAQRIEAWAVARAAR